MSEKDLSELYDRLRETEAQTREQNVAIKTLMDKCEAMSAKCDALATRWDAQMDKMWRLVYILVSVVVAVAIGPKAADKLMASMTGNVTYWQPAIPFQETDLYHRA